MRDSYDADRGVTYIGPHALGIGFALYCIGFLVLLCGANWISETYEGRETATATTDLPVRPAATAVPVVQAPPRAHAGASTALCAPVSPCVRPAAGTKVALPAKGTVLANATRPAARPPVSVTIRVIKPAAHLVSTRPVRAPARVQPAAAPIARASQAPAALLVPFSSASGLTSSEGLDPRAGSHALVVGPNSQLGPNSAATPSGGGIAPRR
jgi:hypothetical protein